MILAVSHISKDFNKGSRAFHAINDVSLSIESSEQVALIGPNGAGKSTLLKIFTGLIKPTNGDVMNNCQSFGFSSIEFGMNSDMTVIDMLLFYGRLQHLDAHYLSERIEQLAEILNFKDSLYKRIGTLSSGNQQKVALSRALIHRPKLLILDEPMNGLDLVVAEAMRNVLRNEKKNGTTLLICSHLSEDISLCDRIVVLSNGKVIRDEHIAEEHRHHFKPYEFYIESLQE